MRSTKAGARVYREEREEAEEEVKSGGMVERRVVRMWEVVWMDLAGERVVKITVRWWWAGRVRRKWARKRQQRARPRPLIVVVVD